MLDKRGISMSLLTLANGQSMWRGYEYFQSEKAVTFFRIVLQKLKEQ